MVLGQAVDQSRINNAITRRKINGLREKIEELVLNKENLKNKFSGVKDRSISLCDRIKQLENIFTVLNLNHFFHIFKFQKVIFFSNEIPFCDF